MGSEKVWERGVALTSTLHWFETDLLAREENLTGLARLNRELVAQAEGGSSPYRVVQDTTCDRSRAQKIHQKLHADARSQPAATPVHPLIANPPRSQLNPRPRTTS